MMGGIPRPEFTENFTTVFIKKDIFLKIGDNFVDTIKYIEKDSSIIDVPKQGDAIAQSNINIKKVEVSNSSHPKLYDYMTNGKSVVFDLDFAKYCLLRGYYKLINNNKLNKEIYGTVEIDPTQAKNQVDRYGAQIRDSQIANNLFNFLDFTTIKPWPTTYPTLDGSPSSNWALAERAPIAGDHFDSSLTPTGKKEYRNLSKIFVPVKLKYQIIEPADIIVNIDLNWGGVTSNNSLLSRLKVSETVVKTIQSSSTAVVTPSSPIRPSLPPAPTTSSTAPSTTTTLPKTTTTTVPRSTTTSVPPKSNTKKPPAKFIPPPDRIDRVADAVATTISNKTPVIIGDSIAFGIALRYDNQKVSANTQRLTQPSIIENIPESYKKTITSGRKMEWI